MGEKMVMNFEIFILNCIGKKIIMEFDVILKQHENIDDSDNEGDYSYGYDNCYESLAIIITVMLAYIM